MNKMSNLIQKELDYFSCPGIAVTLVQNDTTTHYLSGTKKYGYDLPIDSSTNFCIASCSKSMTAALIMRLCDEGILDLDEPVVKYAPNLITSDSFVTQHLTLRDMLLHRTGLANHDAIWPNSFSRDELAKRMKHLDFNLGFREKAQYNNIVYALAGYVAECAAHKSWPQLMREYIFAPLHMDNTFSSPKEMCNYGNYAFPHRYRNGEINILEQWDLDLVGPAASITSCANDLGKWLKFQVSGGYDERGNRLISPKYFNEMHRGQIDFNDASEVEFYPCNKYAFGWQVGKYRNTIINTHMGKIEGYSSIEAILPEKKIGLFITLNLHSPAVAICYTIMYTIFDELLGTTDVDWYKTFHSSDHAEESAYHDCDMDFTSFSFTSSSDKLKLENIVGKYYHPAYGCISIKKADFIDNLRNHVMCVEYRGLNNYLYCAGGNTYISDNFMEDIFIIKMPFRFIHGSGNDSVSLLVPLEKTLPPIQFNKIS